MDKFLKDPETGLEYKTAEMHLRFLAFIVDLFIVGAICIPFYRLMYESFKSSVDFSFFALILIFATVFVCYHIFSDLSDNQASPAKRMIGIYTADNNFNSINLKQSLFRNLLKLLIITLPFFLVLLGLLLGIVFLIIAVNRNQHRIFYDIITGTQVIHNKNRKSWN